MKRALLTLLFPILIYGQPVITGPRVDSTNATATAPMAVVNVLPTGLPPQIPCKYGDMVVLTSAPLGQQVYLNTNTGTCNWSQQGGGGVSGLQDPGASGIVYRTTPNATRISTYADIVALFTTCNMATPLLAYNGVCVANSGGGGGGGASYITSATTSPQTILQSVHQQGINAVTYCFDGPVSSSTTTGKQVNCQYSKNASGDVVITWSGSTVASIQILSSGAGPAGPTGPTGPAGGGVSSVALTAPSDFNVSGSPVTGAGGTLGLTYANQTANKFLASPASGPAAAPSFRFITPADIPGSITSSTSGNAATASASAGSPSLCSPGNYARGVDSSWNATGCTAASGTGTVTSVGLTAPAIFSVGGSPVTAAGTLAITLVTETANTVFAGPATGSPAAPTFRGLTAADIPSPLTSNTSGNAATATGAAGTPTLCSSGNYARGVDSSFNATGCTAAAGAGTVTSVALTMPAEFSVGGSPVTTAGTLAVTAANESANTVYAGPTSGGASTPAFRSLAASDIPGTIGSNTTGNAATASGLASTPTLCSSGYAPTGVLSNGNATGCTQYVAGGTAGGFLGGTYPNPYAAADIRSYGATCSGNQHTYVVASLTAGQTSLFIPASCNWTLPHTSWTYNPGTGTITVPADSIPGGIVVTGQNNLTSVIQTTTPATYGMSVGPGTMLYNLNLKNAFCSTGGNLSNTGGDCPNAVMYNGDTVYENFISNGNQALNFWTGSTGPSSATDFPGVQGRSNGTGDIFFAQPQGAGTGFRCLTQSSGENCFYAQRKNNGTGFFVSDAPSSGATAGQGYYYFSESATSGDAWRIDQDTVTFTGNVFFANMAQGSGGFSGNFLKFSNGGTGTVYRVDSVGTSIYNEQASAMSPLPGGGNGFASGWNIQNAGGVYEALISGNRAGYWEFTNGGAKLVVTQNTAASTGSPISGMSPYNAIVADQNQNVSFIGGTNAVYRCTTAGTLPVGALTINAASCNASADTGLRVK